MLAGGGYKVPWKWPFNKEQYVQLLWIKSPYRYPNKDWMVPLVFQDQNGKIKRLDVPWGLVSGLRFGQFYIDGQPAEFFASGDISTVEISESSKGELYKIKDLKDFIFYKELLGIENEYVWAYYSEKTTATILIPCIEIIRSFLTPNATLARALLRWNGLKYLVRHTDALGNTLYIDMDQLVPKGLINPAFVTHLAWLLTDPSAQEVWDAVLPAIFPLGDLKQPLSLFDAEYTPKKLKADFPLSQCTMQVRGVLHGDYLLVQEIISADNLELPYQKIVYSHPSLNKIKKRPKRSAITKTKPAKKKVKKVKAVSANPSSISKTITVQVSNDVLSFKTLPQLENHRYEIKGPLTPQPESSQQQSEHEKKEQILQSKKEASVDNSASEVIISGAEILSTGEAGVRPIDFPGPSLTVNLPQNGLSSFLQMIKIIPEIDKRLIIASCEIKVLSSRKPFAYLEDGNPRKYAVSTIRLNEKEWYVVEVERLEKTNLSSLIIEPRDKFKFDEVELAGVLSELLNGLLSNYGKWNKSQLLTYPIARISKVKHLDEWTEYDWAWVIYDRLNILIDVI